MTERIAKPKPLDNFVRQADLHKYVGVKRTKINKMVEAGEFPKPMFLGNNRGKFWVEREIRDWQDKQMAKRQLNESKNG